MNAMRFDVVLTKLHDLAAEYGWQNEADVSARPNSCHRRHAGKSPSLARPLGPNTISDCDFRAQGLRWREKSTRSGLDRCHDAGNGWI